MSSTRLRERLAARRHAAGARALLGRPYALRGRVVARRPPRAHARLPDREPAPAARGCCCPPDGVYAVACDVDGARARPASLNIGVRPTFGGRRRTVEAHLLDFDGDLYGRWLVVGSSSGCAARRRFAGPDALRAAIAADVARARHVLRRRAA